MQETSDLEIYGGGTGDGAITGKPAGEVAGLKERAMSTQSTNSLPQPTSPVKKPAAIWARVSTIGQAETSLPSQVSRCKEKLEAAGLSVIQTFAVDWTSDQLDSCPEFQQLRQIIKNQEIVALGIYHRDRLPADEVDRLMFLRDCKKAGVQVIPCQGPEVVDDHSGFLMEFMDTWSKKEQVTRAREGSKTGLRDRAVKFGKPVTFHRLFGYTWDKTNLTLMPNQDWPTLKMVFDMVLGGSGYQPILDALAARGLPKNKAFISAVLHNPVYAGRYFALRKVAVEPEQGKRKPGARRGYGNTSVRRVPLDQAHYLPNVKVIDPPITWDQRSQIFDQLAMHQKLAQRNARRDYLLRARLFCETHHGENGQPRAYHGQPYHGKWRYTCPVGGCDTQFIRGPELEAFVGMILWTTLAFADKKEFSVMESGPKDGLTGELTKLQKEADSLIGKMANLEDERLSGRYNGEPETYTLLHNKFQTRRQFIKQRSDELLVQMAQLSRAKEAKQSLLDLKLRWTGMLREATEALKQSERPAELMRIWREVFDGLRLTVHIHPAGTTGPNIYPTARIGKKVVAIELRGLLALESSSKTGDIALANPARG